MSKAKSVEQTQALINRLDELIRKGQQGDARKILLETNWQNSPREQIANVADLGRRVNVPKFIIQNLKPFVHKQIPGIAPPTPRENALYATALSRLGVFDEAIKILKKIDANSHPEALLFLAHHSMLQWDYIAAIPKLKKYIARKDISEYLRLVGKVNLAACLINEMQWTESDKVFAEIWREVKSLDENNAEKLNYGLLYANSLGLAAHASFLQGDVDKAQTLVGEAQEILFGTKSRYELLVKKWKAIIDLFKNSRSTGQPIIQAKGEFLKMLAEAVKARDWETVRDFEFYKALALRDDQLFLKLYHGTPHTSFRKIIKKLYAPKFTIPKMIEWNLFSDSKNARVFDLSKGCEDGGAKRITDTPLLFKTLQFLTKDFYRPVALGSLFSALYPDEYYDPNSSPNRTYLVIKRLRTWFNENDIPLDIEVEAEWYKLVAKDDYIIRVSFQNLSATKNDAVLESLANFFTDQAFDSKQISDAVGLSPSAVKKFLAWANKENKLRKIKVSKTTKYRLR